jgi:carboxyl-terminal processing protease
VAVAQGDESSVKLAAQSEADLPGHLAGEGSAKKTTQIIKPAPGKKYDDFQLSYALDLLNGRNTVAFVKSAAVAD